MRTKIGIVLTLLALSAAYYVSGRRNSAGHPSDFRDAPRSEGAFEELIKAVPVNGVRVPLPPPPPAATAVARSESAAASDYCGPDITKPLINTLARITNAYNLWSPEQQAKNCAALNVDSQLSATGLSGGLGVWDIYDLRPDLGHPSIIADKLSTHGICRMTVAVDGKCYRHEEANYIMWGLITRLCDKSLTWSNIKVRAYLLAYYIKNPEKRAFAFPGEADNKIAWSEAGYNGWPKTSASPPATRPECAPSRFAPYDESDVFISYWNKFIIW